MSERKPPKNETIGERYLRREKWDCDECKAEFELGETLFDQFAGIICPKCGSQRVGPKRDHAVN